MRNNWFIRGLITNWVSALVIGAGGIIVAFLARNASLWATPALYGLGGSALLAVSIYAGKAIARLPAKRHLIDPNNVEKEVRSWLDNFRVGVRNAPIPEAYFRFIATMDSGTKIIVGRLRTELSGYILLRAEVIPSPEERRMIAQLSGEEVMNILSEIKLELARARVGYSGLVIPVGTIALFKRIPLTAALTEDLLINRLEEMEATINMIALISYNGFRRNRVGAFAPQTGPDPTAVLATNQPSLKPALDEHASVHAEGESTP
jgi:hypothetical protein